MKIGYDKPLYVLPFDHRATFTKGNVRLARTVLSPKQTMETTNIKRVIYAAFRAAVAEGLPEDRAGLLVDEQFGARILHDAPEAGIHHRLPRGEKRPGRVRF